MKTSPAELAAEEERNGIEATLGRLRMAVTPYYLSLIDLDNPYDPVRKQAIPTANELNFAPYDIITSRKNCGFTSAVKPGRLLHP